MTTPTVRHRPLPDTAPHLTHQALICRSDEEFPAASALIFRDGIDQEDAVLAVTTKTDIGLLRQALDIGAVAGPSGTVLVGSRTLG
ncbi:hypothetical protein [Streptomyces sp. NPDC018610]|jgi:hypothetical protein|uniref:hypothetical protein n=1 Tax=Streptomyces sp. NPDC018610 TaxID=3365049 RepID=UPI0037AF71AE